MSLQLLNDDYQVELQQKEAPKTANPLKSAFSRMRPAGISTALKGEYPTSQRLEELLVDTAFELD